MNSNPLNEILIDLAFKVFNEEGIDVIVGDDNMFEIDGYTARSEEEFIAFSGGVIFMLSRGR